MENLQMFCRICGYHIVRKGGRIPKNASAFHEIIKRCLYIDNSNDDYNICHKCRQIFLKIERKLQADKDYKPQITLHTFESHSSENCRICARKSLGRTHLKEYNPIKLDDRFLVSSEIEFQVKTISPGLVVDDLISYGEELGYVYIPAEDMSALVIFSLSTIPCKQIKSLISINIYGDNSFF